MRTAGQTRITMRFPGVLDDDDDDACRPGMADGKKQLLKSACV